MCNVTDLETVAAVSSMRFEIFVVIKLKIYFLAFDSWQLLRLG